MNTPLVSVIMPAYNVEKYINKSISSVLQGSFKDIELIIIEDCSTDGTYARIKEFSDTRIQIIKHERNEGLVYTLNEGLSLCKGKYIYRMDSDDIAYPDALRKQVEFMQSHEKIGLLGGDAVVIDENDNKTKAYLYSSDPKALALTMLAKNCIMHPSVLLRRDVLIKHQLSYSPSQKRMEDYGLWVRLMKYTTLATLGEPTVFYRHHTSSVTAIAKDEKSQGDFENREKIIKQLMSFFSIELSQSQLNLYTKAVMHYKLSLDEKKEIYNIFKEVISKIPDEYKNHSRPLKVMFYEFWIEQTNLKMWNIKYLGYNIGAVYAKLILRKKRKSTVRGSAKVAERY